MRVNEVLARVDEDELIWLIKEKNRWIHMN